MTLGRLRRIVRHRLRAVFRKEAVDDEVARELAFHRDALVQEGIGAGLSLQEARAAASRVLGNAALFEEQCRDQRRVTWLHDLRQDTVHAARVIGRTPGLAIVAVASLALGIGSAAAVIAAFGSVVLQPLPFAQAERLVVIRTAPPTTPAAFGHASLPDFVAWRHQTRSFAGMAASIADTRDFFGDGVTVAERIAGQLVSPSLFALLGVEPLTGRVFTEEDADADTDVAARVLVISHGLWQSRFGGDRSIVGRTIRMSGGAAVVIGIMPAGFSFPDTRAQYWAPLRHTREQLQGSARFFQVTARLAAGVRMADAAREVAGVVSRLARIDPGRHQDHAVQLTPLRDHLFAWTDLPFRIFGAAAAIVLLLACANVACLLLARGVTRAPELAMRAALGAGRGRLVRQLMTEALVLSAAGAIAGAGVAYGWIRSIPLWAPPIGMQRPLDLSFDVRVIASLVAVMAAATALIGIAPAMAATRRQLLDAVKGNGLPGGAGDRASSLRDALVSAQCAMAVVLLIASTLLVASFQRLTGRELHFDPRGVLTFDYRIPPNEYLRPIGTYAGFPYMAVLRSPAPALQSVLDRIDTVPGVGLAAGISHPVLRSLLVPSVALLADRRAAPGTDAERQALAVTHFIVTPGLFAALRTPVLRGREINGDDTGGGEWVAVVNETTARRFWPDTDPIGRTLTLDTVPEERPRVVIGVVPDVPLRRAEEVSQPIVYTSYLQQPPRYRGPFGNMLGQMTFVVRSAADPAPLARLVQQAVTALDPDRPLSSIILLESDMDRSLDARRLYALVLVVFASSATLLAAFGTYGVMAYAVAQRRREIGVRRALGAPRRRVLALVGARAVRVVVEGVAFGLVVAATFARVLESQLYGVTTHDPAIYGAVGVLLSLVGFAACVAPVRRALRVDPASTLRES